jgi:CRP-like cAMP-binding protein
MPAPTSAPLAAFFQRVPVFGGLEGPSLHRALSTLKEEVLPAKSVVFRIGELGRKMYVLREGEVEVLWKSSSGKLVPMFRLGPGECFGEMALVELQPRSATVRVIKKARMYSFTNVDLWHLFREHPYTYVIVLQNICRILSSRLRKADGRLCSFLEEQTGKTKNSRPAGKRPRSQLSARS